MLAAIEASDKKNRYPTKGLSDGQNNLLKAIAASEAKARGTGTSGRQKPPLKK